MLRKRLSFQLAIVLLTVSLVPLLGVGFVTLGLIERSITERVLASQETQARAAAALLRDYLRDAVTKLKSIARMIREDSDPNEQAQRLNSLLDPPDIFLEVGYWVGAAEPELKSQVQQREFANAQTANVSRLFNSELNQFVHQPSTADPLFVMPNAGGDFVSTEVETVADFPSLAISVPASEGAVLTASLDLRPVSQMLGSVAGPGGRTLTLIDGRSRELVASRSGDPLSAAVEAAGVIESSLVVGHGDWRVVVREPRGEALAPLRQARLQAVLWFSLACALATGLAALFGSRVLRPIRALAKTAELLGRGDFSARSEVVREDEIGELSRAFNDMAAALQELDRVKDEFVAHVSHELRTPLTSAKLALANVQEGISGTDALVRVQKDLDRLISMVNELLDLARIEAGLELAREPTALGELVRSTVESLRPLARVSLEVMGDGETLALDRARVHQVIVNLVDNALRHARSRVEVIVKGREVRVTDDGPGVPPELRGRIFEKFARVPPEGASSGFGLGLSIARKLTELHGGTLRCEGNSFVARL